MHPKSRRNESFKSSWSLIISYKVMCLPYYAWGERGGYMMMMPQVFR